MSSNTAINNDGNIVNTATTQKIKNQNNYFGTQPKAPRRRSDRRSFSMVPSTLTDKEFIGHQALLDRVSKSLRTNEKVALYGLGGIGTSRLAAEVANKLHRNTFDCIFWIDATSVTSFMYDMERIAQSLELPATANAASHANTVKTWMETHGSGSWLLVLDAAGSEAVSESYEASVKSKESNFVQRLPRRSSLPLRTILVTTCQQHIALEWCRRPEVAFEVPSLGPSEAVTLLRNMSGDRLSREEDVERLAEELDGSPSALLAAAAFVRTRSESGETISTFLSTYWNRPDKAISFFNTPYPAKKSLTATYFRAIEAVENWSKQACDLLYFIACLDGTRISPKLFNYAFGWEDDVLRTEISTLLNYRLVTRHTTTGCYHMPKLVRLTTRHWIKARSTESDDVAPLPNWHLKALESLLVAYDSIGPQTGKDVINAQIKSRALLPHATAFQRFCRGEECCTVRLDEDHFRAIVVLAELFSSEGQYTSAEDMLGFAMESPVGWSHWQRIAMLRLAESLRNQTLVDGKSRRLKTALRLARKVEKSPGGVESDLWSTFALLHADRGSFDEAARYQAMAVNELAQAHGENSTRTLEARLELSNIRWRKGDLEEALQEQEVIEGLLQTDPLAANPETIPRLLQVQAALVRTHYSLDNLHTAVELAAKVAEGRAQVLGELDMKTIASEKDLSQCLIDLNRTSEAKVVLEKLQRKLRQKFDFSHQEVQDCVKRLDCIEKVILDDDRRSV